MRHNDNFYRDLIDAMSDGVYFVDRDRVITYWNQGAERITGYTRAQATGRRCADSLLEHSNGTGEILCNTGCPLQATMEDGEPRQTEVFLKHAAGHRLPVVVRSAPLRNEAGEIVGAVETFSDNSAAIAALRSVEDLRQSAMTDPLTGIGNRRDIESRLVGSLAQTRETGSSCAVLLVDVDGFKTINDTFGHAAGDGVLTAVAATLRGNIRSSDAVGRFGGDEFLVILVDVGPAQLFRIAEKLRSLVRISEFSMNDGRRVAVTVSIGACLASGQDTPRDLLERADALLYRSKGEGRDRVTIG